MENKRVYVYFDASVLYRKKNLPLEVALRGPAYVKDRDLRFYFNLINHLHELPESKYYGSMESKWDRLEDLTDSIKPFIGETVVNQIVEKTSVSKRSDFSTMPIFYKRIDMISDVVASYVDNIRKQELADLASFIDTTLVGPLSYDDCYMDLAGYYKECSKNINTRKELLEHLYTSNCNLDRLAGFAKNYGISIGILTQDDPVMKEVLEDLYPNTEIIVVPDAKYDFKRKNDPVLYQKLGYVFKREEGRVNEQLVLVDDKEANVKAAGEGKYYNWEPYLFERNNDISLDDQLAGIILDLIVKHELSPESKVKELVYSNFVYPKVLKKRKRISA